MGGQPFPCRAGARWVGTPDSKENRWQLGKWSRAMASGRPLAEAGSAATTLTYCVLPRFSQVWETAAPTLSSRS